MGVPIQRVVTIVNGKRGITAETAVLLAESLGATPELGMGLQADHDLWHAPKAHAAGKEPVAARGRRSGAVAVRHRTERGGPRHVAGAAGGPGRS
jgi:plasmid maintenance system antidote protein VapI